MNIELILKWISNIEYYDGENLSYGSVKTLGDIKKEVSKGIKKPTLAERKINRFVPGNADICFTCHFMQECINSNLPNCLQNRG